MVADENPWLAVPASDYEGHMTAPAVRQFTYLSATFGEILDELRPRSLAVVGCATGNGFERIPPATDRVIGIDINPDYLAVVRRRFADRLPGLVLIRADIARDEPALSRQPLDLVHAALVLEFVEPESAFDRLVGWLEPGGTLSVILQLPSATSKPVTATSYRTIEALAPAMRLVEPDRLERLAARAGLVIDRSRVDTLETGKSFYVGRYLRPAGSSE